MKATKLLTTAAVAALGLTLLAPSALAVNGDAKVHTGKGTVTFKEDDEEEPGTDPEEKTEVPIPPTEENKDKGPLRIDRITTLDFGSQNISTNKGIYNAAAIKTKSKDEAGVEKDIVRGNWIQVTDKRAAGDDGKPQGWTLSAALTKQFQTANSVLNGSTITYANPVVTFKDEEGSAADPRTNLLDGANAGFKTEKMSPLEFNEQGSAQVPMLTAKAGNGFGTYYLQFGRTAEFGGTGATKEDTSAKSVTLTVPANTPMKKAAYESEITWTIAETPLP